MLTNQNTCSHYIKTCCFYLKIMIINKQGKLACPFHNKNYIGHITLLQQALNHGLILKNVHRAIKFKQSTCLEL